MHSLLKIPWSWAAIIIAVIIAQSASVTKISATKMHYIHWNTSNPIFRIDNTDHIIDVNKGNVQFEYDQVNIICPVYSNNTRSDQTEKYIIYNVSKEEYETCRITNPIPRVIAVCDKPHELLYFTITFRSFTPQPGGLEFKPGQDYYFISTSKPNDIHNRIEGRCSTHNMRVVFKVCCDPSSQTPRDQAESNGVYRSRSRGSSSSRNGSPDLPSPTTIKFFQSFSTRRPYSVSTTSAPSKVFYTTPRSNIYRKVTPFVPYEIPTRTKITIPKIAAGTKKKPRNNKDEAIKKELTGNKTNGGQSYTMSFSCFHSLFLYIPLIFTLLLNLLLL